MTAGPHFTDFDMYGWVIGRIGTTWTDHRAVLPWTEGLWERQRVGRGREAQCVYPSAPGLVRVSLNEGVKMATSSLLWTYQAANKPLPEVGSLIIVMDGRSNPRVCGRNRIRGSEQVCRRGRCVCLRLWRMGSHLGELESALLDVQCWAMPSTRQTPDARDVIGMWTLQKDLSI